MLIDYKKYIDSILFTLLLFYSIHKYFNEYKTLKILPFILSIFFPYIFVLINIKL